MNRDEPCISPVYESWRAHRQVASWIWEPPGQTDPLNRSSAQRLRAVLAALAPITRLRSAQLDGDKESLPEFKWKGGPNAAFEQQLLAAFADVAYPITDADIELDLFAWVYVEGDSAPITCYTCSMRPN